MDDTNNRPREMVFCHQCENEWFRDEHGLVCPGCQSDFTEIIETANDPRDDDHFADDADIHHTNPSDAPDPDEDDIDNLRWHQTAPDTFRLRGTYRTEIPIGPDGRPQPQGDQAQGQGGLMGMVGNVLQNMLGGQQGHTQPQQQQPSPWQQGQWFGRDAPPPQGRPGSAPASPTRAPPPPELFRNGRTFIHQGPNFSLSVTTSSNFGGPLSPRNANGPQPFQSQPDHLDHMFSQIFAHIVPGQQPGVGMPGSGMHPFADDDAFMGANPFAMPGRGMPGQPMRGVDLANLFQFFGPPGGVAGDAVYSQEALDRIITQLMEQHQTGNAPGPASEAAIKSLPTKTISESDQADSGKAECSICMDEVPLGGTVTVLPCQHWFHEECIRAWLSEHDTCPHCRQGIMPKDGDANSPQPRQPDQEPRHDMHSPEYTRPSTFGAYPFPRQESGGDGSRQNPFTLPDSPTLNRRSSSGVERRQSSGNTTGGGVFGRMRDAFGGGAGPSGSNGGRS